MIEITYKLIITKPANTGTPRVHLRATYDFTHAMVVEALDKLVLGESVTLTIVRVE